MAATLHLQNMPLTDSGLLNRGSLLVWGGFTLLLVLAPLVFNSGASVSFLSQLCTLMVFCLSYNMLLGQGGMLSFGHAVFSGLGAYFSIHTMNWAAAGGGLPLPFIPIAGGVSGMLFGVLFGYVTTKRSGTTFAMITMGLGELVYASSQMLPKFFGGEGGITANRSYGSPFLGLTFGPQLQVYYLIVVWLLICTVAMYAFTQTPLGRIANAVRDNAERAEFIGYDTRKVRYLVLIISTFFAGISGGLAAINFEIVSAESVSAVRSGDGLLFSFIGGVGSFAGPLVGSVAGGLLTVKLSDYTMAWQLYLGIFFVLFVMYAPAGLSGIMFANWRVIRAGLFPQMARIWLQVVAAALVILGGTVLVIELAYAYTFGTQKGLSGKVIAAMDGSTLMAVWLAGIVLVVIGCIWLRQRRQAFRSAWSAVNLRIDSRERGDAK